MSDRVVVSRFEDRLFRMGELAFWCLLFVVGAVLDGIDARIAHPRLASWEPWTWELSSHAVSLLLLPGILYAGRRWPFHFSGWRLPLVVHLWLSLLFSLLHVTGMVVIRDWIYQWMLRSYDFGALGLQFAYEYLKDLRTYFLIIAIDALYRFWRLRRQGEASWLGQPDSGPPLEPMERPERFLVRKLGREFLLRASDIEVLAASGNYVNLRVHGRDYPLRSTLQAISTRIDPQRFVRVHRSFIINLDHLAEITSLPGGDARLTMRDGLQLPCSRRYREAVRQQAGFAAGPGSGTV
ncbi:LytTR family DNA-binding domain-containing protein [Frateuria aurantia]